MASQDLENKLWVHCPCGRSTPIPELFLDNDDNSVIVDAYRCDDGPCMMEAYTRDVIDSVRSHITNCSDGIDFWYEDHYEESGCLFPDRCLMPGLHFTSECHTVEDIELQEEENNGDEETE